MQLDENKSDQQKSAAKRPSMYAGARRPSLAAYLNKGKVAPVAVVLPVIENMDQNAESTDALEEETSSNEHSENSSQEIASRPTSAASRPTSAHQRPTSAGGSAHGRRPSSAGAPTHNRPSSAGLSSGSRRPSSAGSTNAAAKAGRRQSSFSPSFALPQATQSDVQDTGSASASISDSLPSTHSKPSIGSTERESTSSMNKFPRRTSIAPFSRKSSLLDDASDTEGYVAPSMIKSNRRSSMANGAKASTSRRTSTEDQIARSRRASVVAMAGKRLQRKPKRLKSRLV